MSSKTCFKCGAEKPLADFYKHSAMKDGRVNKCKECNKADVIKNREDKIDQYRAYDRARGSRQTADDIRDYRRRNPNKYKAHGKLNNAVRDGKVVKSDVCECCGIGGYIVGHHADYLKPLDVDWLCEVCHKAWHKENGEGLNGS